MWKKLCNFDISISRLAAGGYFANSRTLVQCFGCGHTPVQEHHELCPRENLNVPIGLNTYFTRALQEFGGNLRVTRKSSWSYFKNVIMLWISCPTTASLGKEQINLAVRRVKCFSKLFRLVRINPNIWTSLTSHGLLKLCTTNLDVLNKPIFPKIREW